MITEPSQHILVLASHAGSLINFRGPLLAAMVADGRRVTAVAPDVDEATRERLTSLGVDVVEIVTARTGMNPFADLAYFRSLVALLRRLRPDVLLAYTAKPVIWGTLAARTVDVPRVVAMMTGLGFAFTLPQRPGPKFWLAHLAARALYRLALPQADYVLFQNPDDRALFESLEFTPPPERVGVTAGSGIDLTRFKPCIPPDRPSFLMLARLLKAKGVAEYAAAATRLKAQYPHVDFRLAGSFDPGPDAIDAKDLERWTTAGLDYLGQLPDIRAAMAAAAVYVLPSYREGTPRSVLEALASGRAVITTDVPGCRETVVNGVNGLLVPARDTAALEAAMERFILEPDLISVMGRASLELARDRFDVHQVNAHILASLDGSPAGATPAVGRRGSGATAFVKRAMDIGVGLSALFLLAPVLMIVAVLVRRRLGAPVLFRQLRPGLEGQPFQMIKFRTMRDAVGADGHPLSDAERLTPFGNWLRATSLDELPELWNVLKGEMSLVGPRPLLMEYLPLYSEEQARRHEVRPGLTGWAQVNGRNAISWDEKFALDVWYVDHRTLWLDLKIIALTVLKIIRRDGISAEGSATMERFTGSAP